MSSCMTKLEFPPEPYMLFRLGKLPHICYLLLHWVLSSFIDPYERFVILFKSRSCTRHPNMHCSYTGGRRKNMPSIYIHPKMFYSYTGSEPKNMLVMFSIHQINIPSSCYYLSKFCCRKETWGYAKVIKKEKEKKKKRLKKWTSVRDI